MFHLDLLEIMCTWNCNLSCTGCDRFIDYKFEDHIEYREYEPILERLASRVSVGTLTLIGGEPLKHPGIREYIRNIRKHWPELQSLEIATNGLLIPDHPEIYEYFEHVDFMQVSLHHENETIRNRIFDSIQNQILSRASGVEPYIEPNYLMGWRFNGNKRVLIMDSAKGWTKKYRSYGPSMRPFQDGNPEKSFENCFSKNIPMLVRDRLYKCPTAAGLQRLSAKMSQETRDAWSDYLSYQGAAIDAPDGELAAFVSSVTTPHRICGMCPAEPEWKNQVGSRFRDPIASAASAPPQAIV